MITAAGKKIFFLSLLLFLHSANLNAQVEPEYSSKVRLVEFIIQATDASGNHVKNLRADEILIRTGEVERKAAFLSAEDYQQQPGGLIPVQVCEESSSGFRKSPRYILFLLHQVERRPGSLLKTRAALKDYFTNNFSKEDYYSLVTFDKKVMEEVEFSRDQQALLEAVSRLKSKQPQVEDQNGFYDYLSSLTEKNHLKRGRLVIILFTEGMQGINFSDVEVDFHEAIRKLQAANIRVFAVDTGGLNIRDPGASIAALDPRMASKVRQSFNNGQITDPTGGISFRRSNNLKLLLERVQYNIDFFYVCGFYLAPGEELREPFKLEVTSSRPGVKLRYKEVVQTIFKKDQASSR